MTKLGQRIADEALALVGVPFRLQGRNACTGLDCIGLVALALSRARGSGTITTPRAYRLRNSDSMRWLKLHEEAGLSVVQPPLLPGDIVHTSPGPAQDHLLIVTGANTFVHAHAGLRQVVKTVGPLREPILHQWRAG